MSSTPFLVAAQPTLFSLFNSIKGILDGQGVRLAEAKASFFDSIEERGTVAANFEEFTAFREVLGVAQSTLLKDKYFPTVGSSLEVAFNASFSDTSESELYLKNGKVYGVAYLYPPEMGSGRTLNKELFQGNEKDNTKNPLLVKDVISTDNTTTYTNRYEFTESTRVYGASKGSNIDAGVLSEQELGRICPYGGSSYTKMVSYKQSPQPSQIQDATVFMVSSAHNTIGKGGVAALGANMLVLFIGQNQAISLADTTLHISCLDRALWKSQDTPMIYPTAYNDICTVPVVARPFLFYTILNQLLVKGWVESPALSALVRRELAQESLKLSREGREVHSGL